MDQGFTPKLEYDPGSFYDKEIKRQKSILESSRKIDTSSSGGDAGDGGRGGDGGGESSADLTTSKNRAFIGGISSMANIGGGGLAGSLKPIERANEIAEKQLETLETIASNTEAESSTAKFS